MGGKPNYKKKYRHNITHHSVYFWVYYILYSCILKSYIGIAAKFDFIEASLGELIDV